MEREEGGWDVKEKKGERRREERVGREEGGEKGKRVGQCGEK